MLRVSLRRVKPGKEARLRAWLAELSARADEVRATFVDETVRHEQAFVLQTVDGPVLLYAMEAADFDRGGAVGTKEDVLQPCRRDVDQPLGQPNGGRIRHPQ